MGKIIDPVTDRRWDEYVSDHPDSTVFHTSSWASVIQGTYGYPPCYAIEEDGRGCIKAGVPMFLVGNRVTGKRLVSLPFTDRCAPLTDRREDRAGIVNLITEVAGEKDARSVEIRSGVDSAIQGADEFQVFDYYKLFLLDLRQGLEKIWAGFKQKSVRYPIRKAESSGLTVRRGDALADMRIFHRLNVLTRRRHGVIPQPYRFFERVFKELVDRGMAFLLIAEYRHKPVAASIFFTFRDRIFYKYNSSSGECAGSQPNHMLLWRAIKEACERRFAWLDMGRTAPDNPGLSGFKRHWGTSEIELPYYYYPYVKSGGGTLEQSRIYALAASILKRTPAAILEHLGAIGYKYFA